MKKLFKLATIFTIIASAFCIFNGLLGAIGLFSDEIFYEVFEYFAPLLRLDSTASADASILKVYVRIVLIIINIMGAIFAIPSLVFAIICSKHNEYSVEAFQRKNGVHIAFLIMVGIAMNYSSSVNTAEFVDSTFGLLNTVSDGFLVASFIFILIEIISNFKQTKLVNTYGSVNDYEIKPVVENIDVVEQTKEVEVTDTEVDEKPQEQPEVKVVNTSNLDDLYTLIAKLEKSYKDGEISKEDYERMKATIVNNYYKSK